VQCSPHKFGFLRSWIGKLPFRRRAVMTATLAKLLTMKNYMKHLQTMHVSSHP